MIAPIAAPRPPPNTPPIMAPVAPPTIAPPTGSCAAASCIGIARAMARQAESPKARINPALLSGRFKFHIGMRPNRGEHVGVQQQITLTVPARCSGRGCHCVSCQGDRRRRLPNGATSPHVLRSCGSNGTFRFRAIDRPSNAPQRCQSRHGEVLPFGRKIHCVSRASVSTNVRIDR